jgi:hypothetical protein
LLTTLLDHKARSEFASETALVFGTSNGRHDNPTNVRQRVLAPAVAKANDALVLAGRLGDGDPEG